MIAPEKTGRRCFVTDEESAKRHRARRAASILTRPRWPRIVMKHDQAQSPKTRKVWSRRRIEGRESATVADRHTRNCDVDSEGNHQGTKTQRNSFYLSWCLRGLPFTFSEFGRLAPIATEDGHSCPSLASGEHGGASVANLRNGGSTTDTVTWVRQSTGLRVAIESLVKYRGILLRLRPGHRTQPRRLSCTSNRE